MHNEWFFTSTPQAQKHVNRTSQILIVYWQWAKKGVISILGGILQQTDSQTTQTNTSVAQP